MIFIGVSPSRLDWEYAIGLNLPAMDCTKLSSLAVRRQTGNGAKFCQDGGAFKACVAGARTGKTYHFRPPFLWFISFGGAKEMNILLMTRN
jgi:hypothetical protein